MNFKEDWQFQHYDVIVAFIKYLNNQSNSYILKGGTSLMLCYGLDRFSEDIDLDSVDNHIDKIVEEFCKENNYQMRVAKYTPTVERYMIHYNNDEKLLKIEISHRKEKILENEITNINGIQVYNINQLAIMKSNAYSSRDKIRDLYDVCFICNNYFDELDSTVKSIMRTALEYKGLAQYEYVIKDQKDLLIDNDKLLLDFLKTNQKLGLLNDYDYESDDEEDAGNSDKSNDDYEL